MKIIKNFNEWLSENVATVSNSSITGMGAMVSAQPGAIPGQTGTTGSGDISTNGIMSAKKAYADFEKKTRKARKKDTDFSSKNTITTTDNSYGYKPNKFIKKVKKHSAGVIPFMDYDEMTTTNKGNKEIANVISANTSWLKKK